MKFRAIISEKEIIYYFTLQSLIENDSEILKKWLLAGNIPDRFTGYLDKHGVDIYENDKVRTYAYNDKWNDGAIGKIEMMDGAFRINWFILLAKSGEKNQRENGRWICSSYISSVRETGIEVIRTET